MPNITAAPTTHKILSRQRNLLVENTAAETDLWTYTVPANTLGTLNALHVRLIGNEFNNSGGSVTFTLKFYFGATVIFNDVYTSLSSQVTIRPLDYDVILAANNATNSQIFGGTMMLGLVAPPTVGSGDISTDEQTGIGPINGITSIAEDSTASKVFKLTVTMSAANLNAEMFIHYAYVELIS